MDNSSAAWLSRIGPKRPDKPVLIVFPHAGSGASAYQRWRGAAVSRVELFVVQLPGRETRRAEPLVTDLHSLVDPILTAFRNQAEGRDFAFLGHSVGSLSALECARRLRALGEPGPTAVGVSGFPAPHLPLPDLHKRTDDEILAFLQEREYLPGKLSTQRGFLEMFLPVLKADFRLAAGYRSREEDPLPCPLRAFGGLDDPFAGESDLAEWRRYAAAGSFSLTMLPGDHFYLYEHAAQVIEAVVAPPSFSD
ncbi:alpha/beta fold hydrolase [Actinocorallia sp. B10E7]|uniref:thioesterase II family protein n=1 Tax=Actinocorallia sp. B10E7 TaxID=3153558 RepID=UPI00325F4F67